MIRCLPVYIYIYIIMLEVLHKLFRLPPRHLQVARAAAPPGAETLRREITMIGKLRGEKKE